MRTRAHRPHERSWGLVPLATTLTAEQTSWGTHGVRRLLLAAERQEWCFLVCSSCLPSYPVAWSSSWCKLCAGVALCQPTEALEEFLIPVESLLALFAHGNLDSSTFALVSFSPCSGVWMSPVVYSVLDFSGDPRVPWFDSGCMFYGRLWTNFHLFSTWR